MANPEQMEILEQGAEVWNLWREENPDVQPDLLEAKLLEAHLSGANLSGADLVLADFFRADLSKADLKGANLSSVDFFGADLSKADLHKANLSGVNLNGANLVGTNLSNAIITMANLRWVDLSEADFTEAVIGFTHFGDLDFTRVKGLDTVIHEGPSTIGIDTVYRSKGQIPESFLRGCGVPDEFITYSNSLVTAAIEYYSAFISYSSQDEELARMLHRNLLENNVRCWLAPEDLKIGARTRVGIDEAIRLHDKLLLILSEGSIDSQWVEQEVEMTLRKERETGQTVLFPVRVDDAIKKSQAGWASYVWNSRNVGDFTGWNSHDRFLEVFERILRDLKDDKGDGLEG